MNEVYLDELTGCYNRRFLHFWVNNEIKRANRYTMKFALILIDLDNFRNINNNFGHLEGDKVLIEFTDFLKKGIREVDHVVRYGGDEFIILVPNAIAEGTMALAQRLLAQLNETEILHHKIQGSAGFALFPGDGTTVEELLGRADNLMYQAKRQGKNQIGLKEEIVRKLQIPSPTTIGRDDEVNWCVIQLKEYNAIFVAGEIGVGKTRTVLEIKNRLSTKNFLRGNAYAALSNVPYHPFTNMLDELLKNNFTLFQRVFKQIPEVYQAEVMKLLPAGGRLKATKIEGLDKYRLYNAVTEFIIKMSQLTAPGATVILLDDVHWMDRASCELLDFLIRSIKDSVKIFGTYRVEEIKSSNFTQFLGIWSREKFYNQLTLAPLNEKQTDQLLKIIVGEVPQYAAKYIYEESGGNPFFIEEILRELERQKKLYVDGRDWVFAKNLEIIIPSSVEETIKRKLTFLNPEIKIFLEMIAVFGQEFVVDIIAMASKRNVGEMLHAFDELRRLGFIKERAGENYFFGEDIVRQIVYKNISKADLIEYHKSVGETIEHFYRSTIANYYEQLAQHFTIAKDEQKALFYSKKAALKAHNNYAHNLAISFYENALKYEKNPEEIFNIKFSIADTYYWTGDYDKAIQNLNDCLKINPRAFKVYEQQGLVYAFTGDYKNSLQCYQAGLRYARGSEREYMFRFHIAKVYMRRAQFANALKECEETLKDQKKMKQPDLGFGYYIYGVVLASLDKLEKAESYLKQGLKINRALDDKNLIAACYQNLALICLRHFNLKACENYLNMALDIDEKIGYMGGKVIARINLGALFIDYDIPKAEDFFQKALAEAKLIGAKRHLVLLYNNFGNVYRARGLEDQSINSFELGLKQAKEINYDEGIIFTHLSLSESYREKNKIKIAKDHLRAAQKIAERLNTKQLMTACMIEEVNYLLNTKSTKGLMLLAEKIDKALKLEHDLSRRIYGFIYKARVLAQLKKYRETHTYYKQAYNVIKSLPKSVTAGEICYLEGLVYMKEKNPKLALLMFNKAKGMFEAVGHLRYLEKVQKEIEKIPKTKS